MQTSPLEVLAISGSLRRDSFNRKLIDAASQLAPVGLAISHYEELAAIPMFNEDLEFDGGGASVLRLRSEVQKADGVLISTPEYNQSAPAVLKNAIDWLSRATEDPLALKPVMIIGATVGPWGTRLAQASLRQTLLATHSAILPVAPLFLRSAATAFDATGQLADERARTGLRKGLTQFARWIEAIKWFRERSRETEE